MTIPVPAVSSKRKRAPASRLGASDLAEIPEDAELISTKRTHLDGSDDIDHDGDVDIDAPVAKGKGKGKGRGGGGGLSTTTTTSKPSLARMESVGDGRSAFRRIIADDKTASQMIDELYQTPEEPIDALEIDLGLDSASISRSASQDATATATITTTAAASSKVEHAAPIAVPVADPATDYWTFFPEPLTTCHPPAAELDGPGVEPTNELYLYTMLCKCTLPEGMEQLPKTVGGVFAEVESVPIPQLKVVRPAIQRDWNVNHAEGRYEQDVLGISKSGASVSKFEYKTNTTYYDLPGVTAESIGKKIEEITRDDFNAQIERDGYYSREIHIPHPSRYDNEMQLARNVYLQEYNNDDRAIIVYPMNKLKKSIIKKVGWHFVDGATGKVGTGLQINEPYANGFGYRYGHDDDHTKSISLVNADGEMTRKYFRFFLRRRPVGSKVHYANGGVQDDNDGIAWYELFVYLRTDTFVADLQANAGTFNHNELKKLVNYSVAERLYNEAVKSFSTATLPSTLDMIETPAAPGFALKLHDYQARTLTWMSTIESPVSPAARQLQYFDYSELNTLCPADQLKINNISRRYDVDYAHTALGWFRIMQLGPDGPFYDLLTGQTMSEQQYSAIRAKSVECRGGILADNTGTGKTVTMLAHIHANPMRSVNDIKYDQDHYAGFFIPSRATLVVCPSHLAKQWATEAKRCIPDKNFKVHVITTMRDLTSLSWNDVILADLIIMSIALLSNPNYHKHVTELYGSRLRVEVARLLQAGRQQFGKVKGRVVMSALHYWRVAIDEYHEVDAGKLANKAKQMLRELHASWYWGMTGTPDFSSIGSIVSAGPYLHTDLSRKSVKNFIDVCVRRNEPNLELPPLIDEIEWVHMRLEEMALYNTLNWRENNERQRLMLCNHYQIADAVVDIAGEEVRTLDQVTSFVHTARERDIANETRRLEDERKRAEALQRAVDVVRELDGVPSPAQLRDLAELNGSIEVRRQLIDRLTREHQYFGTVMDVLRDTGSEKSCVICFEDIEVNAVVRVTRCGHVYCDPCMKTVIARGGAFRNDRTIQCPQCRCDLAPGDIMRMVVGADASEAGAISTKEHADRVAKNAQFGSKIQRLVEYINTTTDSQPDARIILFIQFRRLATLVSSALTECGISHVRVQSNVMARRRAVDAFKQSSDIRVIMLSAEDSVSGLHLTEATHLIILHPFMMSSEKEALSYEAQGIARAHRMGVTHPVRVVRFVVRDTVEEQIARRRMPELASKEDVFIPEKPHLRASALAAAATADTSSS